MSITKISYHQVESIIATCKPNGLFMMRDGSFLHQSYVGIDNTTGEAWTEEFKTKRQCISWLNGEFEVSDILDCLMKTFILKL